MKKTIVFLLIFLVVLSFSAAADNGKIIVGIGEEPDTLDPNQTTRFHSYMILSHVVEPLFTLDKDYNVIPLLLESYDWSDDGLKMTVNLKQGIKFHNGAELTAVDVKASYERYFAMSPLANYLPAKNGGIYQIDTPDKYTVVFHFKTAKPLALYHMADAHVSIMPEEWLSNTEAEKIGRTELIGTGPLQLDEWVSGDRIVMSRFDDYNHAPDFISNPGPAKSAQMIFRVVPEDATMMAELMAGNVDFTFDVPPSSVKVLESKPDLRVETAPTYSVQYLAMNMQKSVIKDKDMRLAVAHAVNKEQIAKAAWFGVGKKIDGLINKATIGYWPGVKNIAYQYDPEISKQILSDLGWEDNDGDGIREKDGQKLELTLITFSNIDQWRKAGEIVQAQLAKIGIKINLETAEVGATYDRAETGDYDIGIFRNTWWLGQPYLRFLVHSSGIGSSNYGQWSTPELDKNIEIAGSSMSLAERTEALNEVQKTVVESGVWVPLVSNSNIFVAKDDVVGVDEMLTHPWWPPLMRALLLHKE
ncbi:ABC transporter substrate-binding protein [Halanaerobium salsuginis]|jgi:peptide/nickel transport system substrate-binding protein|uniref:Peptide/nickel transport system substrate-binding protein n=1 Tax=Halanaerobium salsuginis TaxID=29563 RepID=A0A1I4L7T6_9FIRM|nr:ABC transporter substrate-binding protein [Halanaerobium salsuginis]SFL87030.1 peptide/nickel transport system substrate-binding protein [Halanaerobium salsuginis]